VLWRMQVCKIGNDALKVIKQEDETYIHNEYQTKRGSLHEVRRKSRSGDPRIEKWPIQTLSDYELMEHILEHQVANPDQLASSWRNHKWKFNASSRILTAGWCHRRSTKAS